MTYLGAGVVLLIVGVLLMVFVPESSPLGLIVAIIGGGLILYSMVALGRSRRSL